jgi:TetR/AcrR family transcriptional repressor of nem operon
MCNSEGACGVPRSQRLRDITGQTFQISNQRGGLTTSRDDRTTARATSPPTFHTHTGGRLRNSRTSSSQEPIAIDFDLTFKWLTYILAGMLMKRRATRLRDPERTRERLLQAAFREVYRWGFQTAGLDTILASTGVTKGALYYHFENKEALGYAIVEEVIAGNLRDRWLRPLQRGEDPIDALIGIVRSTSVRPEVVRVGCPLNNLAVEMSALDEGFRKRLAIVFHEWQEGIAAALRDGQTRGRVRRDAEPGETAGFLIAMYEGYVLLAKNAQDAKVWEAGIRNIVGWLRSLRAPGNRKRG